MHGRSPRWAVWLLALWLSVSTPLSALGCLQACERAFETLTCCAAETTRPCSDHPCQCEPCPVCSMPAPQPVHADAKSLHIEISLVATRVDAPTLQNINIPSARLPDPPLIIPDYRAPRAHSLRAPPVLS